MKATLIGAGARIALILSLALLNPTAAQRPPGCTGFSPERMDRDAGIRWSYRICENARGREVHVRFRNASDRLKRFHFRIFGQRVRSCRQTELSIAAGRFEIQPRRSKLAAVFPARDKSTRRIWICLDEAR